MFKSRSKPPVDASDQMSEVLVDAHEDVHPLWDYTESLAIGSPTMEHRIRAPDAVSSAQITVQLIVALCEGLHDTGGLQVLSGKAAMDIPHASQTRSSRGHRPTSFVLLLGHRHPVQRGVDADVQAVGSLASHWNMQTIVVFLDLLYSSKRITRQPLT